jgi:hypothetical protein
MDANDFPKVTELAIPFFVAAILIELWLVRTGPPKGLSKHATRSPA